MVHIFSCLGRDFALDTESGTLLEIDQTARRLIEKRLSPLENSTGDFFRFGKSDCCDGKAKDYGKPKDCGKDGELESCKDDGAANEIDDLIRRGLLFSPEQKPMPAVYSDTVKALCLNVSHNCNLRCKYCFAEGGSYNTVRKNMGIEVAKAAIDFLIAKSKNRKNLEVDFFGGEPLLNLDVVKQTVDYARALEKKHKKNFRFTITTNGVGLTDDIVDYFNKEMYNVVVSIDGRESVHNSLRPDTNGKGSFADSLAGAKLLKQKRGDKFYYIRGTFTAHNKDFAADALALNDLGFDQISLEPVVLPDGHKLALTQDDLPQLMQQYEVLASEYVKRRKGDKWFNFFHFMLDAEGGPCLKKRITGCGAGTEYLAVGPDGDIYPCHRFDGKPEYKIGSVMDGTFSATLPKMFSASNIYTKKDCKDCFAKYYCSGGCAANSIEFGGDINACYQISCKLMQKRTETALAILAAEKDDG